jgi:poly [ADP-ribose] polymerase 10/14/15
MVMECLQKASQSGFTSVAFPALGAGNLSYPRSVVASAILTTVDDFAQKNPNTSLKDVSIVVFPGDQQSVQVRRAPL